MIMKTLIIKVLVPDDLPVDKLAVDMELYYYDENDDFTYFIIDDVKPLPRPTDEEIDKMIPNCALMSYDWKQGFKYGINQIFGEDGE